MFRCRVSTIAAAISLLLCLATVVLWVRSYWINDNFGISHLSGIGTERGELMIMVAEPDGGFTFDRGYSHEQLPRSDETYNPRRVARHTWNLVVAHGEQFPALSIMVIKVVGDCCSSRLSYRNHDLEDSTTKPPGLIDLLHQFSLPQQLQTL